jgi:hypothetical protein
MQKYIPHNNLAYDEAKPKQIMKIGQEINLLESLQYSRVVKMATVKNHT